MTKLDGSKCSNIKECLQVHWQHHDKLLNTHSNTDRSVLQLLPNFGPFLRFGPSPTIKEVRSALQSLNDSTPGASTVPAVAWKCLDNYPVTRDLVVRSVLDFWESEKPPDHWNIGLLRLIPKKGDLSLPGNYRGITLGEVSYKVVARVLEKRLNGLHSTLKDETQAGFCTGRGSRDGGFNFKMTIKKRKEHNLETWALLCDPPPIWQRGDLGENCSHLHGR